MAVEIAPLAAAEHDGWYLAWAQIPERHLPELRDEWQRGARLTYIARVDGQPAGEVSLVTEKDDPDYVIAGRRAYLSFLVVRPAYRRQGVGRALVERVCAEARARGYAELSVGVDLANEAARRLYAECGFDTVLFEGEDEAGAYVKLMRRL